MSSGWDRTRRLAGRLLEAPGLGTVIGWAERAPEPAGVFRVLTYHRVDDPQRRPMLDPVLAIPPRRFEEQIRFLSGSYTVVSMARLLEAREGRRPLPAGAVAITFDDAYLDFAEHAWPILRRYGVPATLFVPTAFPGHPERAFWWDRLHHALHRCAPRERLDTPLGPMPLRTRQDRSRAGWKLRGHVKRLPHREAMSCVEETCRRLEATEFQNPVLDWDALRRLAAEGVTIAPHTRTHPRLNRVGPDEAAAEIEGSSQDLLRELGQTPPVFAYPDGAWSEPVVEAVRERGFRLAFTTRAGLNRLGRSDPLRLRRIHVGRHTTLRVLRTRLLGWLPTWAGPHG